MTRIDERTPLLSNNNDVERITVRNNEGSGEIWVVETAEEVQKISDSIKEDLPKSLVFASVCALFSGLMIAAIDSTLVVSLIGPITSNFGAADRAFWITTAYILTLGSFSPVFGRLFDILGRKACLLGATAIFATGTIVCVFAPSMEVLIIGRAIQGIGGGGLQPGSAIVINDLIPLRSRGYYHALGQLVFSFGFAMGGPLGGFINDWQGWRASFLLQVPPILLAFFLISVFLKTPKFPITKEQYSRQQTMQGKPLYVILWKRCDPLGTTVMISAVILLLLAFSLISAYDLPWSDSKVWGLFLIVIVLLIVFVYIEAKVAEEPIMPMRFMTQRKYTSIFMSYFILSTTQSLLFYFPFYFIVLLNMKPGEIGLRFLTISIGTLAAAFFAGWLMRKTGKYRILALVLVAFSILSPIYLSTWSESNLPSKSGQYLALIPCGFGLSGLNTVLMVALVAVSGQQDSSGAIGLCYLLRTSGAIIGVSASGSFIQKVLTNELNKRIQGKGSQETIELIRKYIDKIADLPAMERLAAKQSYSRALQVFQYAYVAIGVLNLIVLLSIEEKPLSSPKEDTPSDVVDGEQQRSEEA